MADRDHVPDLDRGQRIGFDEAVFCLSKQVSHVAKIIEEARARQANLLLTRLEASRYAELPEALRAELDYESLSGTAFLGTVASPSGPPRVGVVTAGTSDVPVAREVVRTLTYYGHASLEVYDVGVAGLWRLLERVGDLKGLPVLVVIAGMDAALPSVVTGLVPGAVIAVPSSAGYGVAAGGTTALNAALASCAPGLTVVNIDNGYGAACAAARILALRTGES